MSESARTSSDAFDAAVARVIGLHQTQVYGEFVALKKGTSEAQPAPHIMTLVWLPNPALLVEFSSVALTVPWAEVETGGEISQT